MVDWNVVVSVRGTDAYEAVRHYLKTVARVDRTDYYNVLALVVDDVALFLEAVRRDTAINPELAQALARVIPVGGSFRFQTAEQFTVAARAAVAGLVASLAGRSFYVRLHRRGFRGTLVSPEQERQLDRFLLDQLAAAGTPGSVRFDDPDAVVVIETLGQWAGVGLITREQRAQYPFLNPE